MPTMSMRQLREAALEIVERAMRGEPNYSVEPWCDDKKEIAGTVGLLLEGFPACCGRRNLYIQEADHNFVVRCRSCWRAIRLGPATIMACSSPARYDPRAAVPNRPRSRRRTAPRRDPVRTALADRSSAKPPPAKKPAEEEPATKPSAIDRRRFRNLED